MTFGEWIAAVLVLAGTGFALLGALGLQRFPDVFARMHAATKPVTLGLACALLGAALVKDDFPSAVKLLLAAAPVGAHMIGRAAYRDGNQLGPDYQVDELAGVFDASADDQAGRA
jgi:multicomponent Na+:H+ antiporter subunit G